MVGTAVGIYASTGVALGVVVGAAEEKPPVVSPGVGADCPGLKDMAMRTNLRG